MYFIGIIFYLKFEIPVQCMGIGPV